MAASIATRESGAGLGNLLLRDDLKAGISRGISSGTAAPQDSTWTAVEHDSTANSYQGDAVINYRAIFRKDRLTYDFALS
jgi:hypothetical protein